MGTESALALWEPRECVTGLSSSTSFGVSPKSGASPGLQWRRDGAGVAVTAGLCRLESHVLVPFQHRNFFPIRSYL